MTRKEVPAEVALYSPEYRRLLWEGWDVRVFAAGGWVGDLYIIEVYTPDDVLACVGHLATVSEAPGSEVADAAGWIVIPGEGVKQCPLAQRQGTRASILASFIVQVCEEYVAEIRQSALVVL